MILDRRQLLGTFGVASASTLLWAFGCGGAPTGPRRAPQVSGEIRTWLHDAVARLAAVYPSVHALAVSRRRTVAASDVAGAGFGRERHDAVVLTVRDRDGRRGEYVSTDLTSDGVAAAATALGAGSRRARVAPGPAPAIPAEPPPLDETDLQRRVAELQRDMNPSSRIIYRAALIDHDDAVVWSVAPGRDQIQRLTRVRQSATRAAWNGSRPGLGELDRAWAGALDHPAALTASDTSSATAAALEPMTPGAFGDGIRTVVLDPSVAAALVDAAISMAAISPASATPTSAPPTSTPPSPAAKSPAAKSSTLAAAASALVTIVDDPTAPDAFGGFAFDDTGAPAAPLTLIDAGRVVAGLGDRGPARRPGHTAPLQPAASHLALTPGALPATGLYSDGVILEGSLGAFVIPGPPGAGPLVRLPCARARELRAGTTTGRVWADVELVGPLDAILAAIDAIASAPASFVPRSAAAPSLAGHLGAIAAPGASAGPSTPLWRSISAPAVRTRGLVRARRSLA